MTEQQARKKEQYEGKGFESVFMYDFLVCKKEGLRLVVVISPSGYESFMGMDVWKT